MDDLTLTPIKPYIIRAFYEWISDNQLTPYIVVDANYPGVQVPLAYVQDGKIVLNISMNAVGSISLAGDAIVFTARFSGKLEQLTIPFEAIAQIFARENGAGTEFSIEYPTQPAHESTPSLVDVATDKPVDQDKPAKGKPSLKVIK